MVLMFILNHFNGFSKRDPYRAIGATFDGTNDYLTSGAGLTGAADSGTVTVSMWIKMNGGDGTTQRFVVGTTAVGGATLRFRLGRGGSNNFTVQLPIPGGGSESVFQSAANSLQVSSGWVHILFSANQTGDLSHMYANDVSSVIAPTWDNAAATWDFTYLDWAVGALASGAGKANADMADVMVWPGSFVDFSSTDNRRYFIGDNLKPVDPGSSRGAIALLGTPILRLSGELAGWHTNKGSGGGFSVTGGALAQSAISPSD